MRLWRVQRPARSHVLAHPPGRLSCWEDLEEVYWDRAAHCCSAVNYQQVPWPDLVLGVAPSVLLTCETGAEVTPLKKRKSIIEQYVIYSSSAELTLF